VDTIIVAFERDQLAQKVRDILETGGVGKCVICRSGTQLRRTLVAQQVYCVVCGCHLSDGMAEWLCEDLPPVCSMLMIGPKHQLDLCASRDVVKMETPISKEEMLMTVRLLLQFGHRVERLLRPHRSAAEQDLVEQAKDLLIKHKGMTEEEAHHSLQKRSMDAGCRMPQAARQVIAEWKARGGM